MANKDNVTRIPLDGLLNLNKYRNEIRQFDGFNKKNSPIYGGLLSPMYRHEETVSANSKITFVNNDEYSLIGGSYNQCNLYKNNDRNTTLLTLPKINMKKITINVPYNILAFERDENNPNIIYLFVEGTQLYQFIAYNIETETYSLVKETGIQLSKISNVEMKYGFVVFFDFNLGKLVIDSKDTNEYKLFDWSWAYNAVVIDKLCFTINRLKYTFNYNNKPRYLVSTFGSKLDSTTNSTTSQNFILSWLDDEHFDASIVTIKSSNEEESSLDNYRLPTFAPYHTNGTDDDSLNIRLYNIWGGYMEYYNGLYYLSGILNSYDSENHILYVNCNNSVVLDNIVPSKLNNKITTLIATPYFYSIIIKTNRTVTQDGYNCMNHHLYFNSAENNIVGNCGYIPTDDGGRYVPYGNRVRVYGDFGGGIQYLFSFLINYGNISNISIFENDNHHPLMGTTLAEWNFIDNNVTPKVGYGFGYDINETYCLYKISNENTIALIELKNEIPDMEVLFDRYIIFKTPARTNILDTKSMSVYHAFVDYNNRVFLCEKRIEQLNGGHFPYHNDDSSKILLSATLKDYLYTSAVNANMEISKINLSSIQYNPSVINQGARNVFYLLWDSQYAEATLNETIDTYYSSDSRTLIPKYYLSIINGIGYKNESLVDIPFPVARNGNILYSANLFSEIINSYSNRDMIINDTVAYPLTYINNQPSFSFFFLNGIEGANSAFILHGMNYVNTEDFIFAVNYNGDTIGNTEAIVSIKGFRFLGNTTKVAYFYSELKKSVYAFYGDRTLEKVYDCTEIQNIRHTFFNPINYNIYITTDDYIYVIDDNTTYRIEISGTKKMYFADRYIFIDCGSKAYILMYEKDSSALNVNFVFNKVPIKLETQLYGMGNNVKSVIDCVYLRLFNDEVVEQGTLTLNVKTLTDKGETTEEKVYNIKASDWDKETNTFYIRYQPKNQECIGMSVNLESDFAIADFDIGYSTDGTIQVSKYNA